MFTRIPHSMYFYVEQLGVLMELECLVEIGLIMEVTVQAATKSCFNAGFAAQRNFAEVCIKSNLTFMIRIKIQTLLSVCCVRWYFL